MATSTAQHLAYEPSPLVVTEIHSDTEAHISQVYGIDGNLMTVATSAAQTQPGRHLWVEMAIGDSRPMRILTEIVRRDREETTLQVKYLWPRHRDALIEMLAN
ncbi:MAG: hypothetical protein ACI9OJ_003448 [Myxococcota bacterium]|jgi:hypothetical protein